MFWILEITDCWHYKEEAHSKYANFTNVGLNIISINPPGVGVEASISLLGDINRWRLPRTTCESLGKNCVVRKFA
jgi:hypothetical protein